jgi:hypothetical protein
VLRLLVPLVWRDYERRHLGARYPDALGLHLVASRSDRGLRLLVLAHAEALGTLRGFQKRTHVLTSGDQQRRRFDIVAAVSLRLYWIQQVVGLAPLISTRPPANDVELLALRHEVTGADTANEIEILVGFQNSAMVSDQGFHQPGLDMVRHRLDLVAQV